MRALTRSLGRLVAAATLAAAASAVLPAAPASAAACKTAAGVSVVVDFQELGGGVRSACVAGGGGDSASDLFPAAGFSLSYVSRQPGFVCRVDGAPADASCVNAPPADAYWGLWWSDGESGEWTYASSGVGGQTVPDGGYVAFSWNGSSSRSTPGLAPVPHPARPAGGATDPASTDPASTDPSTTDSSPDAEADVTAEPDPAVGDAVGADGDDGGLPAWVAPAAIGALFVAAGAVAVVRRRRGTPGP